MLAAHYRRILSTAPNTAALEGTGVPVEPDLSEAGIRDRLDETRGALHGVVTTYLDDRAELHALAERLLSSGGEALRALRDQDDSRLQQEPGLVASLEVIVRMDGSRPSFLVRNGKVDRASSPVTTWGETLDATSNELQDALECVGRIDSSTAPEGFQGTGFLLHDDLVLTNRHVLQAIAAREDDGSWTISPQVAIDFGHEFRARASVNRRGLRRVVFAGSRPIKSIGPVDHTRLDLALIELEPATHATVPRNVLAVDAAPDWAAPGQQLYLVGYPARPAVAAYAPSLLEELFQTTFGYKRLAPGLVGAPNHQTAAWTVAHDATTLGGNSGSAVLVIGREYAAAGLHYGGTIREPRENWGHVLGAVLDQTDGRDSLTLREHLNRYGVRLIDRVVSDSVIPLGQ